MRDARQGPLSEDGTILLGAKRYARIHGEYLELVEDRAVSSPERPIWRIAQRVALRHRE